MLAVADILKYANLQTAAESFLVRADGAVRDDIVKALTDGNNRSLKFTQTQAQAFADPNSGWTVLAQKANTASGFSGTLFKSNETGELVLSFRSTEFIDDHARDNQATNAMELAEGGFALGQIADMEAWYAELAADPEMLGGRTFSVFRAPLRSRLFVPEPFRDERQHQCIERHALRLRAHGQPRMDGLWHARDELAGGNAAAVRRGHRQPLRLQRGDGCLQRILAVGERFLDGLAIRHAFRKIRIRDHEAAAFGLRQRADLERVVRLPGHDSDSFDEFHELPDVNRLDRTTRRNGQRAAVRAHENAVAAAGVTPLDAMLPRHGLQLRELPITRIAAHRRKQLGRGVHGRDDTAGNISGQSMSMPSSASAPRRAGCSRFETTVVARRRLGNLRRIRRAIDTSCPEHLNP